MPSSNGKLDREHVGLGEEIGRFDELDSQCTCGRLFVRLPRAAVAGQQGHPKCTGDLGRRDADPPEPEQSQGLAR